MLTQEIRTAQTFAAFPVHYRIHLFVAAAFATAEKITEQDIASKTPMFNLLKSSPEDQRHIIGAFELLCQVRAFVHVPFSMSYVQTCLPFLWYLGRVQVDRCLTVRPVKDGVSSLENITIGTVCATGVGR